MSRPLFTNNAATTLADTITTVSTLLEVTAGTGQYFPSPSGGDFFMLTLVQANNTSVAEIIKCTSRSGDILTVVRGQEGTAPQTFSLSDNVELRITAQSLNFFSSNIASNSQQYFTATAGQTVFSLSFSYDIGLNTLFVFVNGSKQIVSLNYLETSTTSITFLAGLNLSDIVEVVTV